MHGHKWTDLVSANGLQLALLALVVPAPVRLISPARACLSKGNCTVLYSSYWTRHCGIYIRTCPSSVYGETEDIEFYSIEYSDYFYPREDCVLPTDDL